MASNVFADQMAICKKYGAQFQETPCDQKVGVALNVRDGVVPINGLRHAPTGGTSGWYIWAGGEPSAADDFFKPLHASHLKEWCPQVIKYLGLSPGWRFLIVNDHEDVWFDPDLLRVID
jgi:hypothetical protein